MKKLLCILLATVMTCSCMVFSASAETSQAEKFISEVNESMSIGVGYGTLLDEGFISINSVEQAYRFHENIDGTYSAEVKMTGSVSAFFIPFFNQRFETVLTDGEAWGYLPNLGLKANLGLVLGVDTDMTMDIDSDPSFRLFFNNPTFAALECASSKKVNVDGLGQITVETLKLSPNKVLEYGVSQGYVTVPDSVDISSLSKEEVYDYLAASGNVDMDSYIEMIENSSFDFYIEDGKLYGIDVIELAENGELVSYFLSADDIFGDGAQYIFTGLDDRDFRHHPLYIDLTFIFFFIAGFMNSL